MPKKIQNTSPVPDREHMIAEAAYYLAEHRSFEGGDQEHDWFEAESKIDQFLNKQSEKKTP